MLDSNSSRGCGGDMEGQGTEELILLSVYSSTRELLVPSTEQKESLQTQEHSSKSPYLNNTIN